MSMDLFNEAGQHFKLSNHAWRKALHLAFTNGWKPEVDNPDFYFWNEGNQVSDADAERMADGVGIALDDIPDEDLLEEFKVTYDVPGGPIKGLRIPDDVDYTPVQYFSGDRKDYLRDFVNYCRRGSFVIW